MESAWKWGDFIICPKISDSGSVESFGTDARVLALLFVDTVGSSIAMHRDEPRTIEELKTHIAFLEAQVRAHGGINRGFRGDGLFASFRNVVDSVTCARRIQQLHEQRVATGAASLRLRIGLHVGDIVGQGEEIYGNHINIASRVEALARPGSVAITRPVRDLIAHRFPDAFRSVGKPVLRNITDELEIFQWAPERQDTHGASEHDDQPETTSRIWTPPTPQVVQAAPSDPSAVPTLSSSLPSVAIMPFEFQGGDPAYSYLAEGIAEDILVYLSRFRQLDVIARASSFALARQDLPIRAYAQQLNAKYIVHGRLRVAGQRLRVSVDLVDPITERTLWADVFDRNFDDVFAVQTEIAEYVVSTMMVRIDRYERELARARNPNSFDVYSLFLQGREQMLALHPSACDEAMSLFGRATQAHPSYARAHAYLSRGHSLRWKYGWTPDRASALESATRIALAAVALDENDPRAHAELGWVSLYRQEHDRSLAAYSRALQLNPSDADIIAEYADALKHYGNTEEAISLFERAVRLNPFQADPYLKDLAHTHFVRQEFEQSLATILRMARPELARRVMIASYALLGKQDQAQIQVKQLLQDYPNFTVDEWIDMVPDRIEAQSELFKEGLKRAGL